MKNTLGILFALLLTLSAGLITPAPVLAATVKHVPGDYPTIQAAIDAASNGDTIVVAAGVHRENVDIDKSLTLEGAQVGVDARTRTGAETIIEPEEGTGIRIITSEGQVVVIDGLTVRNAEHGIATPEPAMADDITVRNVRILNPSDFGISPTFTLTTTVENCYVEGAIQAINAGALVPFPATVATFRNNEIVNSQFGFTGYLKDSLIEGNVVRDFATEGTGISGQLLNTEIKNNTISGYTDGAGMAFESHYGRDLSENVNVEGNTFTDNDLGIYVFDTQTTLTGITFNYNNIAGNSRYGLWNQGGEALDATKNWWGDVSGPGGVGPGDGDHISTKVRYSPWLGTPQDTEPMTWGVNPTSTIQGALDLAGPGDTIIVSDGGYEEDLNISKSLSLRSVGGAEAATITGSITMQLDGEIVSVGGEDTGFTIDANDGDFAISLSIDNGSQVTISQSIITGAQEGITSRGGVLDGSTLTVDHNQVLGNDYGIYLESIGAGSSVLINSNRITGNDSYGVYVEDSATTVDAAENWWGDVDGPSGAVADPVTGTTADGAGDAVSEHVHFDPWLLTYQYALTVSSSGGGSVIVPGEGTFGYDPGTVVNLIAITARFYNFNGWTGDVGTIVNVNSAATNITMKDDYSIVANFGFGPFGWCFIATAAYGSETAAEIDILREFRDTVLVHSSLGIRLVSLYYRTSPPIADFISRHDSLRTVVRVGFLDPIVRILNWSHNLWLSGGAR